jgi:hypothetical protein
MIQPQENDSNPDQATWFESGSGKMIQIRFRQNDWNPDQANETNAIKKKGLESGSGNGFLSGFRILILF